MFRRVILTSKQFFSHNTQRFCKFNSQCTTTFQKQFQHTYKIPKFSKQKLFTIVVVGSVSALALCHFGEDDSAPIYRFVLTGGPCAGKSTALSHIANRLMSMGFLVFMVPEAATLLINGGGFWCSPEDFTPEQVVRFESSLIKLQMALEDGFYEIAKSSKKPCVILIDRGAMDVSAYMKSDEWEVMLDDNGWSVVQLRDRRYDAVFHMVTAAIGAEEFYTTANNSARRETIEEARQLDFKIINSWVGHPHLRVIDNSTDFQGKIQRVVDGICRFVGVPRPSNCVRKFLVKSFQIPHPDIKTEEFQTEQTYIINDEPGFDGFAFVRRRGQNGVNSYTYSVKRRSGKDKVAIIERQISGREYQHILKKADPKRETIRKTVKCFMWKNQYFELIQYQNAGKDFWILKTESERIDQWIDLPPFIETGKEVTGNEKYMSYVMAAKE